MRDQESCRLDNLLHRDFVHRLVCYLPGHATPTKPEERSRNLALDLKNGTHQPNEEIPDVPRGLTSHDKEPLRVIRIAEKTDAAAADRNALAKSRKAKWPEWFVLHLCHKSISRISARYQGNKSRWTVRGTGWRDRMRRIANCKD